MNAARTEFQAKVDDIKRLVVHIREIICCAFIDVYVPVSSHSKSINHVNSSIRNNCIFVVVRMICFMINSFKS